MANALIQVRVDKELRADAVVVFGELGLDLSTAIRMFLVRSVREKGIPFSMKLDDDAVTNSALAALMEASEIAQKIGIDGMTLEEINAEIAEGRNQR